MIPAEKITILLVDDLAHSAEMTREALLGSGFSVLSSDTLTQAQDYLAKYKEIDIILLNLYMGSGKDGIPAASRFSRDYDVPLILMVPPEAAALIPMSREILTYGYVGTDSTADLLSVSIQTALRLYSQQKADRDECKNSINYRSIINAMNESVWVIGFDENFIDFNETAVRQLGYTRNELSAMGPVDIDASMTRDSISELIRTAPEEKIQVFETRHKSKLGHTIPVEICSTLITYGGRRAILSIARDITERKKAEEQIASLLHEKEILLKEAHHRIKNNMGVIRSLLSIQSKLKSDKSCPEILQDAANRIQGMMVLYDKLYRSDSFTRLSIKVFLPSLIDDLRTQYSSGKAIETEIDIEDIVLDTKILSSIGIMISEMFTNSMKYAFTEKTDGRISLKAFRKDGTINIVYADDGIGLPAPADLELVSGFGLELIKLLTKQIDGTIRVDSTGGTRYTLEFTV
ncbi:PAS domain S-box protein [Marispirochaeta aestuarii]|uniref:PAS domain S-box protein n=1 Tax=Marispirochaeta aestuarii TaxID=1963862 RepID=UPI0029C6FCF2|nr:PAS domain S-box protein [Marispirochaeta aestuarii]